MDLLIDKFLLRSISDPDPWEEISLSANFENKDLSPFLSSLFRVHQPVRETGCQQRELPLALYLQFPGSQMVLMQVGSLWALRDQYRFAPKWSKPLSFDYRYSRK